MTTIDLLYNQLGRLRTYREKETDVIKDIRWLVMINKKMAQIRMKEAFDRLRREQIQKN